jgi:hypothetical protein
VKKAAKTTRAAKRGKLPPRAEWDFSKVTRKDSAVICMREYAKECIRAVQDGRLIDAVTQWAEDFSKTVMGGATPKALMLTVAEGFVKRSKATTTTTTGSPLVQVTATSEEMPPPGAQMAMFAINWRATNNEIKRAFGQWLKAEQKKASHQARTWVHPLHAGLGMVPGEPLVDYHDLGVALFDILEPLTPEDYTAMPGAAVIEAQRLLANQRRGRGDSKRALLTDLAVYRLHLAGCAPAQIAKALGGARLKFYDTALVDRAVASAEEYMARTVLHAFGCEAYALGNGKQPPESART